MRTLKPQVAKASIKRNLLECSTKIR